MKSNTRKGNANQLQRSALALAVASAFGLGANTAFALAPVFQTVKIQKSDGTGTNKVAVIFDQGVYSATGSTGALTIGSFALSGSSSNTIAAVEHVAGSTTAILTLSAIDNVSVGTGVLAVDAANSTSIYNSADEAFVSGTPTDLNAATTDAVAPVLQANFTVNNSVQPNTVTLTFAEPLGDKAAAETAANWTVKNSDSSITYTVASAALSADRTTVTLTLAATAPATAATFITNAAADAHIVVTPHTTAIIDLVGNPQGGIFVPESSGTLTKDSTAPTVTAALAKNSATTVTVSFNEKVDKTSAETAANYALSGTFGLTGTASAAALQANGTDVLLTVPSLAGLDVGQTVIVDVTGVTDVAGVTVSSTTKTATYTEATNLAPTLAASAIAVNNTAAANTVTLTFSEALEPVEAAKASNWTVTNNGGSITYTIASAALSNSDKTVTLTLAAADPTDNKTFITNAAVTAGIKVTPNATNIKDVDGTPVTYAGGQVTATGASNTVDSTAPTVTATLTKTSATSMTLSFSEKVDKATAEAAGNYALSGTGGLTGNPSAAALQANGTDVLLTVPSLAGLDVGQTVIVDVTGVTDVAGVTVSGTTKTATYTEATNLAPTLAASAIAVNNTAAANTVTLTFSEALEPVEAAKASNWTVTNNGGSITYTIASAALSNANKTVTLTLAAADPTDNKTFITNAAVTAGIKVTPNATNIKDVDGTPVTYAGGQVTATGGSNTVDSTAPTVTATLTKTSATSMTLSFSEKVDKATAETAGNYALSGTGGVTGNPSAAVLQVNGTDVLLTVATTAGFTTGQTLIVTATGIKDVAGVTISATNVATYTAAPTLAYSATTLTETGGNHGTLPYLTLTLSGDTFVGNSSDEFIAAGKVTVAHVPTGLTARVYLIDSTTVGVYLYGSATSHTLADSITNLTVTFADSAFTGGSAAAVVNSSKNDLHVDFYDSDTAAPTVSTYSPANNATGVATTGTLILKFSESVTAVSGKNIYIKQGSTTVETISVTDTTKVAVWGDSVYINPSTVLTGSTSYSVQIDPGAFVDTNATPNAYAGIADATTWNFTTGAADSAAPTVSTFYPPDNSTNVNPAGDLSIPFNEYIQAGTGNIVIKKVSDNSVVETIPANSNKVSISKPKSGGSSVSINPSTTLALNTDYYIEIDNTAFKDKADNAYAGISGATAWNFKTGATDTFAPFFRNVIIGTPTSNGASASGTANEDATLYYVVMPSSATALTTTEVAAGTGHGGATATTAGSVDMTADIPTAISVSGLSPSTSYRMYFTAKDGANNYISSGSTAAGYYEFTTAAAPTSSGPSGSYTPPPATPPTTTVAPGSTTTIGSTGGTVEAGAGSTLNVTEGSSGATINLPTPPSMEGAAGTTVPSAVNVVIGGNTLAVKPTESGSVVKTATVSIGGKDTTVLNVSAGTAQVQASAANQPLVSVGTGTNAVVISSGSATATVITSVDKTTGVTSLTLPKPTSGNDADASVKMTIGGQDVNVKPQGGADVVVTLKTVTVDGKDVQVVSVVGGSATVTASQPNQPLLAIGSGTSAIVVTSGSSNSEATSRVDSSGSTTISVTSGTITLPSNAFAEANGFAAIKDGKLYAGEVAVLNSAGKVASVRLGTLAGNSSNVGDPLKTASVPGLTSNVSIPNLKGKVARVSDNQDFGDALVALMGAGFTSKGQNGNGVLSLTFPNGSANALPVGDIVVDTNRADGITVTGNGKLEVAKNGVIASFVPAVADPAQLVVQATAIDAKATVTVNDYGVLRVAVNGGSYSMQPGWQVGKGSGSSGITSDERGRVVYQDGAGNQQTLYPAFADLAQVIAAFKSSDANLSAIGNDDGSVTAKFQGKSYTLTPDYALTVVPPEHAKDAWWTGADGKVYIKSSDGKTAQGFTVK